MAELQRLLTAYDTERAAGQACALATVVEVRGSAYRRPGARMLVTADGRLTGTISGGCLEGDARRRAQQVMARGKAEVIVYDSTDIDDDLENGDQLGCQGEVHIFLEPVDFDDPDNPIALLRATYLQEEPSMLATVLRDTGNGKVGQRLLLSTAGDRKGNLNQPDLLALLIPHAQRMLEHGVSLNQDYELNGTTLSIFLELIEPAPRLAIYGAGNDAQPLLRHAASLGWRVTVIDGRPNLISKVRFPEAEQVQVARLADLSQHVKTAGFAVLMSHNYYYDLEVLKQLYPHRQLQYIGMLGPKKKLDLILNAMEAEGYDTGSLTGKLHGPVGLDIGAETAEEIAIAIMAELMAVRKKRSGSFLRDLDEPIHRTSTLNTLR